MDERREDDRRAEDSRLVEAVTSLETRFDTFWEEADRAHKELAGHHHPELDQIVHLLVGDKGNPLAGEKPRRGLIANVDTLASDMEWIKGEVQNGGLKVNLPLWSKVAAFALTVVNILIGLQVLL